MSITPEKIREIALQVADTLYAPYIQDDVIVRYATLLFSEFQKLQEEQEPVAIVVDNDIVEDGESIIDAELPIGTKLYAAPPELTAKVAELEAYKLEQKENIEGWAKKSQRANELAAQNAMLRKALQQHQDKSLHKTGHDRNHPLSKLAVSGYMTGELYKETHEALTATSADEWLRKHDAEVLRDALKEDTSASYCNFDQGYKSGWNRARYSLLHMAKELEEETKRKEKR